MIAEAVDTAHTIAWALLAWIAVLALVGTVVLFAGLTVGVWAVRGLRRTVRAVTPSRKRSAPTGAPRSPSRDSKDTNTRPEPAQRRTAPRWAHTAQETR